MIFASVLYFMTSWWIFGYPMLTVEAVTDGTDAVCGGRSCSGVPEITIIFQLNLEQKISGEKHSCIHDPSYFHTDTQVS